jgi:hypothetical protein
MYLSTVFQKIRVGLLWIPKQVGAAFSKIGIFFNVVGDAKQLVTDVSTELVALLTALAAFVTASIKDGGDFLSALVELGAVIAAAVEAGLVNITADEAVVAAFTNLVKLFQSSHVADILTAWKNLIDVTHQFEASLETNIAKLESEFKTTAAA